MSIDVLQNQIRKLKNPSMVAFYLDDSQVPPAMLEDTPLPQAYGRYAKELLSVLKGIVPAVRFGMGSFALHGEQGIAMLKELLALAKELGFYVLMDAPELNTPQSAVLAASAFFGADAQWQFDGIAITCYIGTDAIKPFVDALKTNDKDLFVIHRTGNKSATELQDLLAGSRLAYMAAADLIKRPADGYIGRCGYSRIAGVGPATSADALRTLRNKYPAVFLLIDGYDYPGANAKNCSLAFDKLGHGAVACADTEITSAWKEEAGALPADAAVQAAERMKKNLTRYVSVL